MAQNIVGQIPEFTPDESFPEKKEERGENTTEEVKQPVADKAAVEEKETPEPPAEKPAAQLETGPDTKKEEPLQPVVPGISDLEKAVNGLQEERTKLLKEISELKGQRREIKQDQLDKVEKQIDDLKDLHPDDVSVIERVLRSKGYVTKEESQHMFYEAVKQEELEKFLAKYPEYKPENDPNDTNWTTLQREIGLYAVPRDPRMWTGILERAHRGVVKVPTISDRTSSNPAIQKRQIEVAGVGGGGAQRSSSSVTTLSPDKRAMLERGGWSEEEIKKIETRLSE